MKNAIILAAGKGSRMNSSINKVMHNVVDKPLIGHLVEKLEQLHVDEINVVVGFQHEQIEEYLQDRVKYSYQMTPLGTADAVKQVQSLRDKKGKTIILVGDAPLIQAETIKTMFEAAESSDLVLLSAQVKDAAHYGRVVRDSYGEIVSIIEFVDASEEQKSIKEINTGIMVVDNQLLFEYIDKIKNDNHKQEYYITDLVSLFHKDGYHTTAIKLSDPVEAMGINDRIQLSWANQWLQSKINEQWMMAGVTLINPSQTYISIDATLEADVTIYPNVIIKGKTHIKTGATILSNSWIEDSEIGQYSTIDASKIKDSIVKDYVTVGPFSHLRMNTVIEDHVRIGNFNEFKKTHVQKDSRIAHLSYLGDSEIGADVNIGCGVVTVNYDGVNKYKTIVEEGAFIGSNCNLIAPIRVGAHAVVAAGSTISQDVNEDDMVIERAPLIIKNGKGLKYLKKEGK